MSGVEVRIRGIEDVNRVLREIAPKEAQNLMRATIDQLARDAAEGAIGRMAEDTGDMKAATGTKRERVRKNLVRSTVRVGKTAFYWRFREYGQGPGHREDAMFLQTLQAMRPELGQRYLQVFTDKLIARLKRLAKKKG